MPTLLNTQLYLLFDKNIIHTLKISWHILLFSIFTLDTSHKCVVLNLPVYCFVGIKWFPSVMLFPLEIVTWVVTCQSCFLAKHWSSIVIVQTKCSLHIWSRLDFNLIFNVLKVCRKMFVGNTSKMKITV